MAGLQWLLGDGPAYQPARVNLLRDATDTGAASAREPHPVRCRFEDIEGSFYYPENAAAAAQAPSKFSTIIWLAPLHCSTGYWPDYRTGDIPHVYFAKDHFLVFTYDPIATGQRQEERRHFYEQYPHWSLMGKMVIDARHALDAVLANPDADPNRISLVGFGMGGMVATLTAALDERVAACVSASGFTPFRTDTDASGTGGIRRWSHLYGWLPRLGAYVGRESAVPVDFPDILRAIAPRRVLVIAPLLDWHNPQAEVLRAVELAKPASGAAGAGKCLEIYAPAALAEFNNAMQERAAAFLHEP